MQRPLIHHLVFFRGVLEGTIQLANDQDADCFASWKVGGQDFYVYGIKLTATEAQQQNKEQQDATTDDPKKEHEALAEEQAPVGRANLH